MQIRVNNFSANSNYHRSVFTGKRQNNTMRNAGLALAATTLLTLSCNDNKKNDIDNINQNIEMQDTFLKSEIYPSKTYYYTPKEDNVVNLSNYDWSETTYPDGSIKRDSAGYDIHIAPNGARTVTYSEKDDSGNTITTTEFPDGSKYIKTNYNLDDPKEILYTEKKYNKDSVLIENKYFNKILSDSVANEYIVEKSHEVYSDNGILLKWQSNISNPERDEQNNKYDKLGRLIYDDVKNEKYIYNDNSDIPSYSFSIYDGCKRITEYDEDGSVKKVYFKASDGTITE